MKRADLLPFGMLILVITTFTWSGCSYSKKRWNKFKADVQREAAKPRTAQAKCEQQGGILFEGRCHTPSENSFDEQTCRLRGGLYVQDECYFPPEGHPRFQIEEPEGTETN